MADLPDERPTPRPRPTPAPRPSPRPRVAGSRREREPSAPAAGSAGASGPLAASARRDRSGAAASGAGTRPARRRSTAALVLAVSCLLAAAGGGLLLQQRLHPSSVDAGLFAAARSGVQALYAFDYKDPQGSVGRKLDVLTGDLREQYRKDLSQGGIVDTYQQVSATTSYDVLDVGLQQVNDAQDAATMVVFGQYVVKSVTSGSSPAPQGSECTVTPQGAQSCTQTIQVHLVRVGSAWKISDLTLLTKA